MKKLMLRLSLLIATLFGTSSAFGLQTSGDLALALGGASLAISIEASINPEPARQIIVNSLKLTGEIAGQVLNTTRDVVILTGEHALIAMETAVDYGVTGFHVVHKHGKEVVIFVGKTARHMVSEMKKVIGVFSAKVKIFAGDVAKFAMNGIITSIDFLTSSAEGAALFAKDMIVTGATAIHAALTSICEAAGALLSSTAQSTWVFVKFTAKTLHHIVERVVNGVVFLSNKAIKATIQVFEVSVEGGKVILTKAVEVVEGVVRFAGSIVSRIFSSIRIAIGARIEIADLGLSAQLTLN